MKIGPIPGIHVTINVGHPGITPVVKEPKTPKIRPEVIQQRLDNLAKGRQKLKQNSSIYPKVVSHDDTPEGSDLRPKPRRGYYN